MRLIDADALKREKRMADRCEDCERNARDCQYVYGYTLMDICSMLDDAPTVGGWISVKDRLPENQNPVIVFVPPHVDEIKGTFLGYVGMAYHTSLGEGFWCGTDGNLYGAIGMICPPTHWMPLPEPPKEEN